MGKSSKRTTSAQTQGTEKERRANLHRMLGNKLDEEEEQ